MGTNAMLPRTIRYGGPVEDGQSPRRKSSMGPQPTKPDTHYYTGARGPTTFPPATLATTATFAAKFLPPRPASEPPPKAWTWQTGTFRGQLFSAGVLLLKQVEMHRTDTQIKFGRFRSKVESTYPQQLKRVKATWASSEAELFEAIMRKR